MTTPADYYLPPSAEFTVELAELLVQLHGRGEARTSAPPDDDLALVSPGIAGHDLGLTSEISLSVSDDLAPKFAILRDLRHFEEDLKSGVHISQPLGNVVNLAVRDDDGQIVCRPCAEVAQLEGGVFFVPLESPVDVPVLVLLKHCTLSERVGILAQLVRVLGDVVRFGGLSEGIRGDAIRSLGELVGLLSQAVGVLRGAQRT